MSWPRRSAWLLLPLAVGALLSSLGCGGPQPPLRDCTATVWIHRDMGPTHIVGSWNGWRPVGTPPVPGGGNWMVARFALPPGEHGYLLERDGRRQLDPSNALTTFHGEQEVSLLLVADCSEPRLALDSVKLEGGRLSVEGTFLAAETAAALASVSGRSATGEPLDVELIDPGSGRVRLSAHSLAPGKHTVSLVAVDEDGIEARARAAAWSPARDRRDEVVYQVMVDRFRGPGGAALSPPPNPGARAGGTLDGVSAAIADRSLASLGVTALWLSPLYLNPDDPRPGNDGHLYEGYHGYWPLESRQVDPRLGGEAALDALVDHAHAASLSVLLDLVPNHVYETHPRYLEHQGDGWFSDPGCVCGGDGCPWGENIERCWFTPYLPDVRWQNADAARAEIEDASFWMRRFDLDGVRIDAVPMMPRAATRRIVHRLRRDTYTAATPTQRSSNLLLGEIYTGPGVGAVDALGYYLGSAGLDSAFDFPLMWALHDVMARGSGAFPSLEAILDYQEQTLGQSAATLARMIDNHDTPRFVSVAQGDAGADPWSAPPGQPTADEPYQRAALALATLFTLPGIVVLFQGDEIGLAGAGDPDSRRVMPAEQELLPPQLALRDTVSQLGRLRRCSEALRRGARIPLLVGSHRYVYLRDGEHPALVLLSTATEPNDLALAAAELPASSWHDAFDGSSFEVQSDGAALTVPMQPLSFRVLLSADDPCL